MQYGNSELVAQKKHNKMSAVAELLSLLNISKEEFLVARNNTVNGGSINKAFLVSTKKGTYFIKHNASDKLPGYFETEAQGLELIKKTNTVKTPEVLKVISDEKDTFLIEEFIERGIVASLFVHEFGKDLARMHKTTADYYGLDYDNYIGTLHQNNKKEKSWIDFFIVNRIEPQLKLLSDSGKANNSLSKKFKSLFQKLNSLIPPSPPSLLHGDLWSENWLIGKDNRAYIFDPAVYYGHREADIAMTKLFGGFNRDFYTGYNIEWPLEKGWELRTDIFNLYPLLVHANLFDTYYLIEVNRILDNLQ